MKKASFLSLEMDRSQVGLSLDSLQWGGTAIFKMTKQVSHYFQQLFCVIVVFSYLGLRWKYVSSLENLSVGDGEDSQVPKADEPSVCYLFWMQTYFQRPEACFTSGLTDQCC